ncbi:MAG: hypothetical protein J6Y91_06520 [Alphaproteobacteria bacterium]|nr:hypothetical protein [Alphaproteobacteria bacterium]
MKLYHYVKSGNTVLKDGLMSFAANPNADLSYYIKRSGADTHEGIVAWMEKCFTGRSRCIRMLSEPVQWTPKSEKMWKAFVSDADRFTIDVSAMEADGLIEAIYVSPPIAVNDPSGIQYDVDEELQTLKSVGDIPAYPVDWTKCDDELGLRFSVIPYYLLCIKGGVIPPRYIHKEN